MPTVVPEWLNKVADENAYPKPSAAEYIENVLLPTRATKVCKQFKLFCFEFNSHPVPYVYIFNQISQLM